MPPALHVPSKAIHMDAWAQAGSVRVNRCEGKQPRSQPQECEGDTSAGLGFGEAGRWELAEFLGCRM